MRRLSFLPAKCALRVAVQEEKRHNCVMRPGSMKPLAKEKNMGALVHAAAFSPTRSSIRMARLLAEGIAKALDAGVEVRDWTLPAGRETPVRMARGDVLVFGFPVYGGRVPGICLPCLGKFQVEGLAAVALAVYGNRNYDDALLEAVDLLAARGFRVAAAGVVVAEHCIAPSVAAGRPDARDRELLADFAAKAAEAIAEGRVISGRLPGSRPYKALSPAAPVKPVTLASCTRYGTCAVVCPLGIIDKDDFSRVGEGCLRCCACVKFCPQGAKVFEDGRQEKIRTWLEGACRERREPEFFF